MRRAQLLGGAALALALAACGRPPAPAQWAPMDVASVSVPLYAAAPSDMQAGELTFRGGLVLTSAAPVFGGLSGLHVEPDGRFIAHSDEGSWFTGQIVTDAAGTLLGVTDVRVAAMRDESGAALQNKREGDAEDIAKLPDGRYAVSFEQRHRILIYDLDGAGPDAPAEIGPVVGGADRMSANEGLEALAALADGRLIGAAEYPPRGAGNPFWIFPANGAETQPAGVTAAPEGYAIVSLDRLPNGDVVRLDRYFLPLVGVRAQVRIVPATALEGTPPRLDGTVIATLEPPAELDNFEAIAAAPQADGSVRLYLLSDNNFTRNQRTMLFAFDWRPPTAGEGSAPMQAAAPPAPPPVPPQRQAEPSPPPAPARQVHASPPSPPLPAPVRRAEASSPPPPPVRRVETSPPPPVRRVIDSGSQAAAPPPVTPPSPPPPPPPQPAGPPL